jgi:site-specific recombinase XerD
VSIKKTESGQYRVEVYLGLSGDGKKIREVRHLPTRREAKLEHARLEKLKGKGLLRIGGFSEIAELYFASLDRLNRKDNTRKAYRSNYDAWIAPFFDHLKIGKLSTRLIDAFVDEMELAGATDKTRSYTLKRLKGIVDWAYKNKHISDNPFDVYEIPVVRDTSDRKVKYHTSEEVFRLLDYMAGNEDRKRSDYLEFMELLYSTGLRIAEGCGLLKECWDSKNKVLDVRYSLNKYVAKRGEDELHGAFILDTTKGNERRRIFPCEHVCQILDKKCKNIKPKDPIFTTTRGRERDVILRRGSRPLIIKAKVINSNEFTKDIYNPYQKRAGLENILGIHGTRHTFGVAYMESGGRLEVLQKEMGHKDIKSTQIYADFSDSFRRNNDIQIEFKRTQNRHEKKEMREEN